jgi:hypothetical protein
MKLLRVILMTCPWAAGIRIRTVISNLRANRAGKTQKAAAGCIRLKTRAGQGRTDEAARLAFANEEDVFCIRRLVNISGAAFRTPRDNQLLLDRSGCARQDPKAPLTSRRQRHGKVVIYSGTALGHRIVEKEE